MIEVNNLTKLRISERFLKKLAEKVLEGESASRRKKAMELSIAVVEEKRIKELNKKYRKKNKATDVLSFQYDNSGEVVICPKFIRKNAQEHKLGFENELARVLVHGVLHILGYSHQGMKKKEEYYLYGKGKNYYRS